MVDNFFPYSQKQLGFDKPITIVFHSDEQNANTMLGKTAFYDPENYEIYLFVDKRHPKDILRSLSHELVHHAQNCRGDLRGCDATGWEPGSVKGNAACVKDTGAGYAQRDPHMRKMEQEAYTKGNLIFRDFEDLIKTGKINIEIDFSDSGEPKMSLKEWKNDELNMLLMKKWGLLKENTEAAEADTLEEETDGEADLEEEQAVFAPNHYCVHHGGVQHEGKIHMAEAVSHNYDKELGRVTHYDMKLEDGTLLEAVAAEDIQVTDASLAEQHEHRVEDEAGLEGQVTSPGDERGQKQLADPYKRKGTMAEVDSVRETKENTSGKISVREAKELTRRIIERIKKENK